MGKTHFRYDNTERNIPSYLMTKYVSNGERGALCGYMRKNTTRDKEQVTCFYCKRLLVQINKHQDH